MEEPADRRLPHRGEDSSATRRRRRGATARANAKAPRRLRPLRSACRAWRPRSRRAAAPRRARPTDERAARSSEASSTKIGAETPHRARVLHRAMCRARRRRVRAARPRCRRCNPRAHRPTAPTRGSSRRGSARSRGGRCVERRGRAGAPHEEVASAASGSSTSAPSTARQLATSSSVCARRSCGMRMRSSRPWQNPVVIGFVADRARRAFHRVDVAEDLRRGPRPARPKRGRLVDPREAVAHLHHVLCTYKRLDEPDHAEIRRRLRPQRPRPPARSAPMR